MEDSRGTQGRLNVLGINFPISDFLKDSIIDAETISRRGGCWTAILVIKDPQTQEPFVSFNRWQLDRGNWKLRKSIFFKRKRQIEDIVQALSRLKKHLEE